MAQSDTSSQEVLRDEILADARRQAERAVRKAEREGQAAIEKAKEEAQRERDEKLAAAQAEAERKRMLTLATVPVDIGRMRAAKAEQMLHSLREQAAECLESRQGFDYGQTLPQLAVEAISHMEGDAFVLALGKVDLDAYGPTLADRVREAAGRSNVTISVDPQPAAISNGVVIRDLDGRQVWDNSLDARLDRMWPLMRSHLAEQLGLQTVSEPSGGQS